MSAPSDLGKFLLFAGFLTWTTACLSHGEDWTVQGKNYRNVHVTGVGAERVSINYDGGTGQLYLADLTPELQAKYKKDAERAKSLAALEKEGETDPIAHLVATLSSSAGGMWVNGEFVPVRLPEDASPEDLAASALPKYGYPHYQIVKAERRSLLGSSMGWSSFVEILVHTAKRGDKILFLAYEGKNSFWWNRLYDSGY